MKNTFLSLFLLLTHFAWSQIWHISGTGNDANDGKSPETAFRSLQKVADLVQPGDVVLIGNGTYSNDDRSSGSAVLSVRRSGKPDAWITWRARPGHHPEVHPSGWAGIQFLGSYHILDGLTVLGNNDAIVLRAALEESKNATPDPYYNTNGILVDGRKCTPDQKPHHIIVRNCVVGKCPGGGIVGLETDYLTIEDCRVYENGWFMRYGGSGITTLNNWAFDNAPGYHVVIQRNYVWDNKTLVPWTKSGKLSDGNGILLDVTDQTQGPTNPVGDAVINPDKPAVTPKPKRPEWTGRALIANNVSAFNGGSGIHTFRTRHVDILNNTTYWNGQIVGYQELFPNVSDDIVIMNNIIVPRPGGKVTSNNKNTNIRWDYNLYPVEQTVFTGTNNIVADPHFIDVRADLMNGNFRLAKDSKGHNSGSAELTLSTDITGKPRPKGVGRDRGAFEQ